MNDEPVLTNFTDDELLSYIYNAKQVHSNLVLELAARLGHALDEVTRKPQSPDDVIDDLINMAGYGPHA